MSDYTLSDLRSHLVSCFEPNCCIIGNTTCAAIVEAIDAMATANLREIQRLDGELAKVRAERDEAERMHIGNRDSFGRIIDGVNDALNRAGIFCAITFAEAIDRIAKERDAARVEAAAIKSDYEDLAAQRNGLLAEVSRLKAGLVEMRETVAGAEPPYSLGRGWRDRLVESIDALIGKEQGT